MTSERHCIYCTETVRKVPGSRGFETVSFLPSDREWGRKVKCWEGNRSGMFEYAIEERREYSILLDCGQINLF